MKGVPKEAGRTRKRKRGGAKNREVDWGRGGFRLEGERRKDERNRVLRQGAGWNYIQGWRRTMGKGASRKNNHINASRRQKWARTADCADFSSKKNLEVEHSEEVTRKRGVGAQRCLSQGIGKKMCGCTWKEAEGECYDRRGADGKRRRLVLQRRQLESFEGKTRKGSRSDRKVGGSGCLQDWTPSAEGHVEEKTKKHRLRIGREKKHPGVKLIRVSVTVLLN